MLSQHYYFLIAMPIALTHILKIIMLMKLSY